MAGEKVYKCGDCGFIGPSVKKFKTGGWLINTISCVFISIVASVVGTPFFGIPLGIAAYVFGLKDYCASCGSKNVVRYFTEKDLLAIVKDREEKEMKIAEKNKLKKDLDENPDGSKNIKIKIIGGSGWEQMHNSDIHLKISQNSIGFFDLVGLRKINIPFDQVRSVEIGGPGKVTSGPGISGGGFGVEGAITGMAVATVANILLTHNSTKTIVRLLLDEAEVIFLSSEVDPDGMRMVLSPLYVSLGRKGGLSNNSVAAQLAQIKDLHESGALSEEQYQKAVDKFLS